VSSSDLMKIANDTKNLTALIVEDRADDNDMMVKIFSSFFSKIYTAADGEEGLALYKKQKPDIVITDLIMPNKDGIEMIEDIKKINKDQIMIVISASDDIDKITKTLSMKITSFVNKPIEMLKLTEALSNVSAEIQKRKTVETKAFTITIPVDLYESIMDASAKEHISKNGMIIRALKSYDFK